MSDEAIIQPVPLNYVKVRSKRWWQSKWVWQSVALVAVLWMSWNALHWGVSVMTRYRCYQLQQRAMSWPTGAEQAGITYAPPALPVSVVPQANVTFQKALAAARSAEPWKVTSPLLAATPIFCHALTTPAGATRLVQVYASIDPANASSALSLNLFAVTYPADELHWVIHGTEMSNINGLSMPDIATENFYLRTTQTLSITGGTLAPSDHSVVNIGYSIGSQRFSFRIHLIDSPYSDSKTPRMAMEELPDPWTLPGHNDWYGGIQRSGFYEWPVAPVVPPK